MSRRQRRTKPLLHPANWGQWLALFALWLMARLPYRAAMRVGDGLGAAAYLIARRRRAIAHRNLELCYPDLAPDERRRLLRDNFRYLGRGLAETALGWYGNARVDALPCEITGREHLEAAAADGTPVIILSAHFMCIEMVARLVGHYVDVGCIYKPMTHRPVLDRAMASARQRNLTVAVSRDDVRGILGQLRSGVPLWFAGDQDYGRRNSVFVPFFGVDAATITTLSTLARMTGARVVPAFFHADRNGDGYGVTFEPALDDFPCGDDTTDARRMNEVVQGAVSRYPEQYLWVHRRFKRQPDRTDVYAASKYGPGL